MSQLTDMIRAKYPDAYKDMSDADLEKAILAKYPGVYDDLASKPAPATTTAPRTWWDTAEDVGIGALKGLGSTATNIGNLMVNAGMVPGTTPALPTPVLQRAQQVTTATNTPQLVGKIAEQVGEAALPVAAAVKSIPSAENAATKFQTVMSAAKNAPVDVSAPGDVALRIQQLADRGGTMPRMVRQFLGRVTDPTQGPLTYEEGRDFASNISRLSADEYNRLTPVMQREVGNLRTALNSAVGDAAGSAGQGDAYQSAMSEYARSKALQDSLGNVGTAAAQALPYGLGGGAVGAGAYAAKKLIDLLMGGGQ